MIIKNLYVPDKDKNTAWAKSVLEDISHYGMHSIEFNRERYKTWKNYEMVKGFYDMAPMAYMTKPFGDTTPANWHHYDFLRVKLEKILGDWLGHPLEYYAHITNREGHERKLDLATRVATHIVTAPHRAMIQQMTGVDVSDPTVANMSQEDQAAAMGMSKKDMIEEFGENALDYLINRYHIDQEYLRCLWDLCICSKAFMRVKIVNGDPISKRVDPRALIWDCDVDSETLETSAWQAEERYLTVSQILQEGRGLYSDKDIKAIKSLTDDYVSSLIKNNNALIPYFKTSSQGGVRIRVINGIWCSTRMKEFYEQPNPYDEANPVLTEITDQMKEESGFGYRKKVKYGAIKYLEGDDWWEGQMIGYDIFPEKAQRRMANQMRNQSYGYAQSPSSYKGVIKDAVDGVTMSIVERMEPILLKLDEVFFNIDFLLGRTNGNVMQYDIAQQPDNLSRSRIITLAKNHGIVFVDSRKEGVRSNAFNQFSTANMSNTADIIVLMQVANGFEAIIDQMIGTNRGWTGDTKASDTLGNTQNDVMQANSIMRPLYNYHSRLIEQSLNGMADLFKYADWTENGRMSFILDDGTVKSFKIPEGFRNDDLGIFYKDGYEQQKKAQEINTMINMSLQSGQLDFGSALNVYDASTAVAKKRIFEQGLAIMQKNKAAQAQSEQAMEGEKNKLEYAKIASSEKIASINAEANITSTNIKEQAITDRNVFDKKVESDLLRIQHGHKLNEIALQASADEELPEPQQPAKK